jgi:hypothetical protein
MRAHVDCHSSLFNCVRASWETTCQMIQGASRTRYTVHTWKKGSLGPCHVDVSFSLSKPEPAPHCSSAQRTPMS